MPADTETRIVEMRFNSRDFDRNIAKSQKSLEDFKKELDFDATSRGLKEFTSNINNINFSHLANDIDRLTNKFTGLGDAGEWVMSRIRNGIESAMLSVESFMKSFTTAQIGVGQGKYDALNKAAQALIASGEYTEEQAYQIFQRVMDYTDQTSANFEVMVDKLQEFTSTGRGLQESERALEGIFNLTAKLGKGANEASAAMGIFSKAMGQGYLSLEKWQSLNTTAKIAGKEFRNELIEAAVATGDLIKQGDKYYVAQKYRTQSTAKATKKNAKDAKKAGQEQEETLDKYLVTAENLETTLSKKWVSKDTMMAVFDKYYFAKLTGATEEELNSFAGVAYKSAQRALTFADAMNAVKESISSGWMTSFRLIFGDVTEAMELFTNLCERVIESIYGLQEARNNLLRTWSEHGGRAALIDAVLGDYGKEIETGAYGLLDLFDDVGKVISEGFWNMVKLFTNGTDQANWEVDGFKEAWLGLRLKDFSEQIRDFIGSIKGFFTEEVKVGNTTTTRLEMVKGTVDGIAGILVIAAKLVGDVMYFVDGLRQQLQPTIDTVHDFFSELGKMLYGTAEDMQKSDGIKLFFDDLLAVLSPFTSAINDVTEKVSNLLLAFIKWGKESGFFASVGKTLKNIFIVLGNIISRIGVPVLNFFSNLFDIFTGLFSDGFSEEKLASLGEKIKTAFENMIASIFGAESWDKLKESIKELFGDIYESLPDWAKGIVGALAGVSNTISAVGGPIIAFFGEFFGIIADLLGSGFSDEKLTSLGDKIKAAFNKMISAIVGSDAWKGIAQNVTDFFGNIEKSLPKSVQKVIRTIKKLFGLTNKTMNYAKPIGILASAGASDVGGLKRGKSKLEDTKSTFAEYAETAETLNLGSVLQSMLGNAGGILENVRSFFADLNIGDMAERSFSRIYSVLTWFKNLFEKIVNIPGVVYAILGIFAIRGLSGLAHRFVGIFKPFSSFLGTVSETIEDVGNSLKKKINADRFKSIGKAVLALSIGIGILVGDIILLASLDDTVLTRGGLALAGIMLAIFLLMKGLNSGVNKLDKVGAFSRTTDMLALAISIRSLGSAVKVIVKAVQPFSKMSDGEYAKSMGVIAAVMIGMVALVRSISKKGITKGELRGVSLIAFGIAAIMVAMIPVSKMPIDRIAIGLAPVFGILLLLGLFIGAIKKMKATSVQITGIAGLAGGIALIMLSLLPMAFLPWKALAKMGVGLLAVLGMLAGFVFVIKTIGASSVKLTGMIGLAVGVGLLVLALIPLALFPKNALIKACAALLVVTGSLALLAYSAKSFKIGSFLGLLAIIGVVMAVMYSINNIDDGQEKKMLAFAGAIAILAIGMGVAIRILAKTNFLSGIGAIVTLGLFMAEIAAIVHFMKPMFESLKDVMKDVDGTLLIEFAASLALVAVGISAAIALLSAVPFVTGLKAIALFGVAMIALVAILNWAVPLLLGEIGNSIAEFSAKLVLAADMIDTFSTRMNAVDDSGVDRAGGIFDKLNGLIEKMETFASASATVTSFTTALFELVTGLESWQTHAGNIVDPESSNAFKMIDKVCNLGGTLSTFSVGNFATEVVKLGAGLGLFDYIGDDIGDPNTSKPLVLLQNLASCANDLQTLTTLGLGSLTDQIAGLGGAMSLYAMGAQEITGVEGNQTTNIQGAMAILQEITKTFAEEGGFTIPNLPEEADLGGFGAQLAALAGALVKFAEASNGLGEGTDKAITLLGFLAELKGKLTKDNLESAKAFQEAGVSGDTMTAFSNDIFALGSALRKFINSVKNIDEAKMNNAMAALDFFAKLKTRLITQDSVIAVLNFFTGNNITNNQLVQFGKDIEALGSALKTFATSVSWDEGTEGSFQSALDALRFLSKLKKELPRIGGLVGMIAGRQESLSDLAAQIILLGDAMGKFNDAIIDPQTGESKLDTDGMNEAIGVMNLFVGLLQNLQTQLEPVGSCLEFFTGEKYNATFFAQDMEGFTKVVEELIKIGGMLNNQDSEHSIPTKENMESALKVLEQITEFLAGLQAQFKNVGGIVDMWEGKNYDASQLLIDVDSFKKVIAELFNINEMLAGRDEEVKLLGEDALPAAVAAVTVITEYLSGLQEQFGTVGGIIQTWVGRSYDASQLLIDVTSFKNVLLELLYISDLLNGNDENVKMLKEEQLPTAIGALDLVVGFLKDLRRKMPSVGGWVKRLGTAIAGNPYDINALNADLIKFKNACRSLVDISDTLNGNGNNPIKINSETMASAKTAISTVLDFVTQLGNDMPKIGGFLNTMDEAWNGRKYTTQDLNNHLDGFKDACTKLVEISDILNGKGEDGISIDEGAINNARTVVGNIVDFSNMLAEKGPKVGGMKNFFNALWDGGEYSFDDLRRDMENLGKGMGAFSKGVGADFNADSAMAAIDVASSILETMSHVQRILLDNGDEGDDFLVAKNNIEALSEFLKAMTQGYMPDAYAGKYEKIPPMIESIIQLAQMVSEAVDKANNIKPENINIFSQMAQAIQALAKTDPSFNFEPTGKSIAEGIARGMTNSVNIVTEAARKIMQAAIDTAKQTIDSNSPSKVFMEIGSFMDAGLVIGMNNDSSKVENAASDMMHDAIDGASSVLGIISQLLGEELDANPTITPVLDLTDLSNGITLMNGMLDGNRMSIDASTAANLAANNLPQNYSSETNQNGTDLSGIYDRMAVLGDKIAAMGDQIAKMKVVLDTGAIAGAVTDQVDENIGAKAFYAGRGN